MKPFIAILKYDYLQRTRSYAFLITLCLSLAIAYTFVPEPNASYSTIRIADYVGYYNSAWFGYVTAIMTSIFLSLIGFYLVNSSIATDVNSKIGQVFAATPISNFKYLFSKVLSNFLVLLSIVCVVIFMSVILFFLYNDGYTFEPLTFIKPYFIIMLPALFFVSVLAVIFEVIFKKYTVIQNVGFFILFSMMMVFSAKTETDFALDVFGSKIVIEQLQETVKTITNTSDNIDLTIGYVLGNVKKANKFLFEGITFPTVFILSRLLWVLLGISLIVIIAPLFHRFNVNDRTSAKKVTTNEEKQFISNAIQLMNMSIVSTNYNIFPLIKTDFLLLLRKGKKWLWLINLIGMILLLALPLSVAHQMVLPVLWFLQVHRLSDLTSKEITNHIHYFSFSSYKPLSRLLVSQLLSAIALMLLLALPLIIRLGITTNFEGVISIILGSVFIVSLTAFLGILTNRKKLFEILFFMITYANLNRILFVDYFGGLTHSDFYLTQLGIISILLISLSILKRKHQLSQ